MGAQPHPLQHGGILGVLKPLAGRHEAAGTHRGRAGQSSSSSLILGAGPGQPPHCQVPHTTQQDHSARTDTSGVRRHQRVPR
jgi:hypothetical protein